MDRKSLILEAQTLPAPGVEAGQALSAAADFMAAELTQRMLAQPDLTSLIGKGNEGLMETNHLNHFRYVASLGPLLDPVTLVETVLWVFRTYCSHGFSPRYWKAMLPEAMELVQETLPLHREEIQPLYEWLARNVDDFALLGQNSSSFFEDLSPVQGVLDDNDG